MENCSSVRPPHFIVWLIKNKFREPETALRTGRPIHLQRPCFPACVQGRIVPNLIPYMATERRDKTSFVRSGEHGAAPQFSKPTMSPIAADLRTDVLTGQQVIVAESRSLRPVRLTQSAAAPPAGDDPFLEGRESLTPGETLALRAVDSQPNEPGWLLRVVPNQFPAAESSEPEPAQQCETPEVFLMQPVRGVHEVVLECPDYRAQLTGLAVTEVARVLHAWQLRVRALSALPWISSISVFRNEGIGAGASLPHCHSQILATDFIGDRIAQLIDRSQKSREETGQCIVEQWLSSEISADRRVLRLSRDFATVCPFASRVPWQCRIVPLTVSRFDLLSAEQICSLAAELHSAASAVQAVADNVAHNVILTLPPPATPAAFLWHLDLLPRPSRMAGFEFGTNVDILAVAPETAVARMQEHVSPDPEQGGADALCPDGFTWVAAAAD
jgi:UDPglucose--hexose-1-phosphate uridylyltransferase